jgi:hypothetical protein
MKKVQCKVCGRNVCVSMRGVLVKHRIGRSSPSKVKPVCTGSGKHSGSGAFKIKAAHAAQVAKFVAKVTQNVKPVEVQSIVSE